MINSLYRSSILTLVASLVVSGCSLAPPDYSPTVMTPAKYKEQSPWKLAKPLQADTGPWWLMYADPVLHGLEIQIDCNNQTLEAALARYDYALGELGYARAGLFPNIVAAFNPAAAQTSQNAANPLTHRIFADISIGLNLIYEIDVWGRIRNMVKSAANVAKAQGSDVAAISLGLHATLAEYYFSLRGRDAAQIILNKAILNYQKAYNEQLNRYRGGIVSRGEVDQAKNQLESAKTLAADNLWRRAQLEHAIAVLIGIPPALLTIKPTSAILGQWKIVNVDPGLPSTLLERRPDVAAAEQLVHAANANIGVARAAFFPKFTLTGGMGFDSQTFGKLFKSSSLIWAIGPAGASTIINSGTTPLVSLQVFDGGRLIALTHEAWAKYHETIANYRQTVLNAFQEVEDSLIAIRQLDRERKTQHAATTAANLAVSQAFYQYHGGQITYLDIVVLYNIALQSELSEINITTQRQIASVQLIRALGGGYGQIP